MICEPRLSKVGQIRCACNMVEIRGVRDPKGSVEPDEELSDSLGELSGSSGRGKVASCRYEGHHSRREKSPSSWIVTFQN